jgi:hypothetical protein
VDFTLPEHLPELLDEMDAFIEAEIKPLERENMQYFDQRRENARTDDVLPVLRTLVRHRLAIDHPGYDQSTPDNS